MQSLQQAWSTLGLSIHTSRFPNNVKKLVHAPHWCPRPTRCFAPEVSSILSNSCSCKNAGGAFGRSTRFLRKSERMKGVGVSLKEGYELTDPIVVDESHMVASTDDVIEKLKNGFKRFKEGEFKQKPDFYSKLAEGQHPKVMMITCADSRVCPTMLHGLEAGEAFIVRNVANMVPPCEGSEEHHGTSAAIEFAVTGLGVEHIVVMGHSSCGGIQALMTRDNYSGDFVGSWVRIGYPAKLKTLSLLANKSFKDQCSYCAQVEPSNPKAELRMLEVFYHKIYKIFPLNEKIENINDQYWTLRAEEIPDEEKDLGIQDRLIHVYHFTRDASQNHMVQNFGEPFFLVVRENETLAEVKERIRKKLLVPDDEFAKWKFAFLSLGRPEYLQEGDVVASRFQKRDTYGAWEHYLGLEHTDSAPKRSHTSNQNRHNFEKPVKIYN